MSHPSQIRYSVTSDGQCVVDPNGAFSSLEECQKAGLSVGGTSGGSKDINLLIYQYNPAAALALSKPEQVNVLKQLTGLTIPIEVVSDVLASMEGIDLDKMVRQPLLFPYLRASFPRDQYIEALRCCYTFEAFMEMDGLDCFGPYLRDVESYNAEMEKEEQTPKFRLLKEQVRKPYDRKLYIHLETIENDDLTGRIHVISEGSLSSDLLDYLTDKGGYFYNTMTAILNSNVHDVSLWTHGWYIPQAREMLIKKHPQLQRQLFVCCRKVIEGEDDTLYSLICEILKCLAVEGIVCSSKWVCNPGWSGGNAEKFEKVLVNPVFDLCISGLLTPVEKLKTYRSTPWVNQIIIDKQYEEIKKALLKSIFENDPEYIPDKETVFDVIIYLTETKLPYPAAKVLYVIEKYSDWIDESYFNNYIDTLPLVSRLGIRQALQTAVQREAETRVNGY